ncbi:hypothetical protein ABVF61_15820 [Roseibium sp. HPY-6]|uniref:hypothetical protein n=1 Tax=Roseibium sp. HPY-6 TaxID=3229852 RepID=UPI00338EA3F0
MRFAALIVFALASTAATAHGGHEEARTMGDAHWFASADHLLMLMLGGLLFGVGVYALLRRLLASRTQS